MKRGEIYYAFLSPAVGSEMDKRRPVLIVSNDANNRAADTVTILPITSNVTRVYPFEVLINPDHKCTIAPQQAIKKPGFDRHFDLLTEMVLTNRVSDRPKKVIGKFYSPFSPTQSQVRSTK